MDKEQKGSKSSLVREKVALPAVLRSLQNADIATDLKESRRKGSGPCRVTSVQQALIETKQDAKSPGNSTFPGFFHARKSLIGFHGLSRILTGVL